MPKILERLVSQLMAKGISKSEAYAIATYKMKEAGNIDSNGRVTPKGIKRGNMTPAERANDRKAKRYGGSPNDYVYNSKNNTSVKGAINFNVKPRK